MISLIFSCLCVLPAQPPNQLIMSTVWLRAGDRATGTGFVVDQPRRWIVTARHVVGDQDTVELFFHDPTFANQHRDQYLRNRDALRQKGRCVRGKVIARRDVADLALIEADTLPNDAKAVSLATGGITIGDRCVCYGHRFDGLALWTRTAGIIRQSGQLREGYSWAGVKLGVMAQAHYLQMPIDVGDSGSAVLNSAGNVIGIVSAWAGQVPSTTIVISSTEITNLLISITKSSPREQTNLAEIPRVIRATVWVRPEATEGRYAGALFHWDDGIILTSAGAVGMEERVNVIFPKIVAGRLISEETEYTDRVALAHSGHLQPAVVLYVDRQRDLALLKVAQVPPTAVPLHLAGRNPKVGDMIFAVSHPIGVEMQWLLSTGSVRGAGNIVLHPNPPEDAPRIPAFALQLPHQGRCSGGPVVNSEHELIAVLSHREGPRKELAFCVQIEEQRTLMTGGHSLVRPIEVEDYLTMYRKYRLISESLAEQPLKQGLTRHPHDWRLHTERLLRLEPKLAERDFAKLSHQPKTSDDFVAVGRIYAHLNVSAKAKAAFDEAIRLNPKNPRAYHGLAMCLPLAQAEEPLQVAESLVAGDGACHRIRASKLLKTTNDERKRVIEELTRLLEAEPYDVSARHERAKLALLNQDRKRAEADYRQLVEWYPLLEPLWFSLAEVQLLQGKELNALQSLGNIRTRHRVTNQQLLVLIRDHSKRLLKDDPNDGQRVEEWLKKSLHKIQLGTRYQKILEDPSRTILERVNRMLDELEAQK